MTTLEKGSVAPVTTDFANTTPPTYDVKYISRPNGPKAGYHIHVDAQADLPDATIEALESIGFVRDDFIQSGEGEPTRHMTAKPKDETEFKDIFLAADRILLDANSDPNNQIPVYTEGEVIPLDEDLPQKAFDEAVFNTICPVIDADNISPDIMTFECPVLNKDGIIIGAEMRELPLYCEKRPLEPSGEPGIQANGTEYFRKGEVHATFRKEEMDPRTHALIKAMNFSSPIIPKMVEGEDGKLIMDGDKPLIVNDIPFTIQTAGNMRDLNHFTNLVLSHIVMRIGGYKTASIKSEPIIAYGHYGGIDIQAQVPKVMSDIRISGSAQSQQDIWDKIGRLAEINGSHTIAGFDTTARAALFNAAGALKTEIARAQQWPSSFSLRKGGARCEL